MVPKLKPKFSNCCIFDKEIYLSSDFFLFFFLFFKSDQSQVCKPDFILLIYLYMQTVCNALWFLCAINLYNGFFPAYALSRTKVCFLYRTLHNICNINVCQLLFCIFVNHEVK